MLEPDVIHRIQKSLYVDDLVTGAEDSIEALKLYETMKDGGLNLRKLKSNDVCVRARIQEKENEDKQTLPKPEIQVETKMLGLGWNQDEDTLTVQLTKEQKEGALGNPTKRGILSQTAAMYDPLGVISPVTVTGRIILQKLYRDKKGSDARIDEESGRRWKGWVKDLERVKGIVFNRISCASIVAARSSSLGIDSSLIGATLVLAVAR